VARTTEGSDSDKYWYSRVSQNDNWIASVAGNCFHIWTRTGEAAAGPLTSIDNYTINTLALSPGSSGLVAYVTFGGTVCVLSASTGMLIRRKKWNIDALGSCLAFSPSTQTHLAVGIGNEIFIWDTMTDEVAGPFTPHGVDVSALMFPSDGRYITSVARDCTLCLWNSSNGRIERGPVKAVRDYTNFSVLALDGRMMAFSGINNTIMVFELLYEGDSDIVLQNILILAGHMDYCLALHFRQMGNTWLHLHPIEQ